MAHRLGRDGNHILAYAGDRSGNWDFYVQTDQSTEMEPLGEMMPDEDVYCSYSPDRQWVVNDTYPDDEGLRTLMLYEVATDRRIDIGKFYSPAPETSQLRCDLHPRWHRDGTQISFDGVHEGSRQIYLVDVGEVVSG